MHPLKALTAISLLAVPATTFALGIRIADQDARATGRGDAFAATADNPSAVYYNPAGLTQLYTDALNKPITLGLSSKGKSSVPFSDAPTESSLRARLGVYSITLENRVDPLAAGAASFDIKRNVQFAPNFFASYKVPNAPLVFGLGMYAPYGFGLEYPEDSPLRALAISGSINYISINPVLAWQVCDSLSIAAGPTFNYAKADLKRGIFAAHDRFQFAGEGWSVGWNAGLMWRPHPMHSFGVTYRSQTDVDFEGSSNTHYNSFNVPTPFGPFPVAGKDSSEPASAGIKFPQNVVVGYSFRPTPKWNLEVNIDWTDWDNLNTVNLRQKSGDVALPFNWESSLFYEFGATYTFDNGLAASLGYIYSENSVPNESFNPVVPDSNRHIFSAGLGAQWDHWGFDLAYQYAHGPERTIRQGTAADGSYSFDSHAVSLSLGYKF
jgi:long-chain fatty acid transport protein